MLADKLSIKPGDTFTLERTFTEKDVVLFTEISNDRGEHHLKPDAKGRVMLQGLLTASLATQFGGSIDYLANEMVFRFVRPVFVGDTVRCDGECTEARDEPGRRWYAFKFAMKNQAGKEVLNGTVNGVVLR